MLNFEEKRNIREIANDIFTSCTKYKVYDIQKSRLIHNGYTNISFHFTTTDEKQFQIRIGNAGELVDRENELNFLKSINNTDFIYLNPKTGDAIKKWVDGINPSWELGCTLDFTKRVYEQIKKLHSTPVNKGILKQDFFCYLKNTPLKPNIKDKYLSLLVEYKDEPLVMSHNDLNPDNMLIMPNKSLHFIDYEWSRLNHELWDIANYIREVNLPLKDVDKLCKTYKIDFEKMCDYLFISTCFAYQWTFYMNKTEKILKYRDKLENLMNFYFERFY